MGHFPACFSWNHFSQHGLWVPRTVQLIKIRKKYDANITIICRLYHYRISQSENNMMIICFERRTRECKCSLKWESVAAGLVWQEENGRWVLKTARGQTWLLWLRRLVLCDSVEFSAQNTLPQISRWGCGFPGLQVSLNTSIMSLIRRYSICEGPRKEIPCSITTCSRPRKAPGGSSGP